MANSETGNECWGWSPQDLECQIKKFVFVLEDPSSKNLRDNITQNLIYFIRSSFGGGA